MPDETLNQESIDNEESLFGEIDEEDATPSLFDDEQEDIEEEAEQPTEASEEPFLNIRYNKEDVALTRERAIELSQKGMNYDKVLENYNTLNAQLESLAKANEMSVADYLGKLNEMQESFAINQEVQKLREQYPHESEELLTELARTRIKGNVANQQKEIEAKQSAESQEVKRQVDMFRSVYPDAEIDKLNPQVYDLVKSGFTLLEAYHIWKKDEDAKQQPALDTKAKIKAKNEANRKRSLGSTSSSAEIDADDFLKGFLG